MNREGKPSDELTGKESSSESRPDATGVTAPALFPLEGNMGTSGEQGRTIPEQGIAPEAKPTNHGSRVSAGEQFPPSEKQDPNQSLQLTTQEASQACARNGSGPPSGAISPELFLILRSKAVNSFHLYLGGITNEVIEYLLDRQKLTQHAIPLERAYIRVWAARYWGAVRRAAVSYAGDLGQAIGLKKGLGPRYIRWILREAGTFFRQQLMGDKAANFLTESSNGIAEIRAPEETDAYFQRTLNRYAKTPLLMKPLREKLAEAQELYGRTKKSRFESNAFQPTPVQKLANPKDYPLMDAKEVAELFRVSRSTVARWVDEGKLERAGMGKKQGKRARLRIFTQSVKEFLERYFE